MQKIIKVQWERSTSDCIYDNITSSWFMYYNNNDNIRSNDNKVTKQRILQEATFNAI